MHSSTVESTMSNSPHSEPIEAVESPGGRLSGEIRRVSELSAMERQRMFELLCRYFARTGRERFEIDLSEKEWAILLRERQTGEIQGFSTLMRITEEIAGEHVTAFFSGDTIIHRDFWGETVLPRLWSRHVFRQAALLPGQKVYWFLISSGYKTYRFLPVFFREFYPCHRQPTPVAIKGLLDKLGQRKHGGEYDARTGIIRFREPTPLQEGVAEITAQRLADPHVVFFCQANPGHGHGDELACITRIDPTNLTAAGRRMVGDLVWPS